LERRYHWNRNGCEAWPRRTPTTTERSPSRLHALAPSRSTEQHMSTIEKQISNVNFVPHKIDRRQMMEDLNFGEEEESWYCEKEMQMASVLCAYLKAGTNDIHGDELFPWEAELKVLYNQFYEKWNADNLADTMIHFMLLSIVPEQYQQDFFETLARVA